MCHICFELHCQQLGDIPHQHLYGQTLDISLALCFEAMNQYIILILILFPPPLKKGKMGWFAPNIHDTLTFHILMDDTHHIIYQSAVHSALIENDKNLHLKFSKGMMILINLSNRSFILMIQRQKNMRLFSFNYFNLMNLLEHMPEYSN